VHDAQRSGWPRHPIPFRAARISLQGVPANTLCPLPQQKKFLRLHNTPSLNAIEVHSACKIVRIEIHRLVPRLLNAIWHDRGGGSEYYSLAKPSPLQRASLPFDRRSWPPADVQRRSNCLLFASVSAYRRHSRTKSFMMVAVQITGSYGCSSDQ
jgi:hypothetical protein